MEYFQTGLCGNGQAISDKNHIFSGEILLTLSLKTQQILPNNRNTKVTKAKTAIYHKTNKCLKQEEPHHTFTK